MKEMFQDMSRMVTHEVKPTKYTYYKYYMYWHTKTIQTTCTCILDYTRTRTWKIKGYTGNFYMTKTEVSCFIIPHIIIYYSIYMYKEMTYDLYTHIDYLYPSLLYMYISITICTLLDIFHCDSILANHCF